MSSSSSSGTSFVLILMALGALVWLVQKSFDPAPKTTPELPEEEVTSLPSRALDASSASGDALSSSMDEQLKSVQGMVGGTYEGKTYVPPHGKK